MAATQQDEQMPQEETLNVQAVEEKASEVVTGEEKKELLVGETGEEKKELVEGETGEEFSYLQRNEFTSEIYKIEVRNLGYFGIGVSFLK